MQRDYPEVFEALRHVYLEDSWVLQVEVSASSVTFELDLVLTDEHPEYLGARPGDQYDYRPAELLVTSDEVRVALSGRPPAISADGSTDLGNTDTWRIDDDHWSLLKGEWGSARVLSASVRLTLGLRI